MCNQLLTPKCVTAYSSTDSALRSLPGTRLPTFLWTNTSPALSRTRDMIDDVMSQYRACDSVIKATYPRPKISLAGTLLSEQPKYRNRGVCGLTVSEVMRRMRLLCTATHNIETRESPSF